MASLADIPERYLAPEQAGDFTDWLATLPVDFATARALGHLWQQATHHPLGTDNWTRIEQSHRKA